MSARMVVATSCRLVAGWDWSHDDGAGRCDWSQWGQSPAHDGEACSVGQDAARELGHVVVDPFADQEIAETGGAIFAHYQVPLVDDDGNVFVMQKAGSYLSCDPPGSGEPFPCGDGADLNVEWRFQNTSTETCERQPDGTIACFHDGFHPTGFEWCANAVAVDREGTVYTTSEDGNFYAVAQGGTEKGRFFLNRTLGAVYTPLALDARGRIYAMNDGDLFILGR